MLHMYRKTRAVFAAAMSGLLILLLAACSATTVSAAGSTSSDALASAQPTSTPQSSTSSILTLNVQPYQYPFTVYEIGQAMSQVVATGSDDLGPGDPITATINWGDKTAPTQYTFIDGRTFQVAGAHAYSKVGKYTITVTAAITQLQQSVSGTGTITAVPAYTLSVKNITYKVGQSLQGVIATGTDPFPNDPLKGTIDWGDSTTPASVQVVSSAQGAYQVSATHTYTQAAGSFTITVSLTSIIVGPVSGTGTATVASAFALSANRITARTDHPFQSNVATVTGTISSGGLRVIIEWGDGTTSKLSLGGGKGRIQVQGSHTYSQAGTYSIIIIVKDNGTGEQAHVNGSVMVV